MSKVIPTEVLVIGAGPAGIAAATAAAEHGCRVMVLDDNRAPGGQIWREPSVVPSMTQARDLRKQQALDRLARSRAVVLAGRTVFNASASGFVEAIAEGCNGSPVERIQYDKLILATGARERFLPFPGWTLQGVFGAGGLQALAGAGYSVADKRVVVAGTGPLLLAVAAHLQQAGAVIGAIAEQASLRRLGAFAATLWRQPSKLAQGWGYRRSLRSVRYRTGTWVLEAIASAEGNTLSGVRMTDGRRKWIEPCDLLACGYHLVPNTELAALLGCNLRDGFVEVDRTQRTSIKNIFCVGEPAGIAGLEAALVQGEIAGLQCAGRDVSRLHGRAEKERAFGKGLERAFALRDELRSLPQPETIVCRCEDVTFAELRGQQNWLDSKLHSRCGMGPCQGRVCGPASEFLLGWRPTSVRPPLYPVPLRTFSAPGPRSSVETNSEIQQDERTEERV